LSEIQSMKTRVGVQHEPAFKDGTVDFHAHDVLRIEVPDVPVLGQMRMEIDQLPTDLAKLNREINNAMAGAMAAGFDYGVMAARANPDASYIDPRNARIFETLFASDPVRHAEHVGRSTKSWTEDTARAPVDWVDVDEKTGQLRVKR
jgi:hypothetical protein